MVKSGGLLTSMVLLTSSLIQPFVFCILKVYVPASSGEIGSSWMIVVVSSSPSGVVQLSHQKMQAHILKVYVPASSGERAG